MRDDIGLVIASRCRSATYASLTDRVRTYTGVSSLRRPVLVSENLSTRVRVPENLSPDGMSMKVAGAAIRSASWGGEQGARDAARLVRAPTLGSFSGACSAGVTPVQAFVSSRRSGAVCRPGAISPRQS